MTDDTEYGRASGKIKKTKGVIQWIRTTAHQSHLRARPLKKMTRSSAETWTRIANGDSYMTVYVRIISGKTISIKCERRQTFARILHEVERKTMIPKDLHYLTNEGECTERQENYRGKQH